MKTNKAGWQLLITGDSELLNTLKSIRERYHQPAMACALVNSNKIIAKACAGTVVYGQNKAVKIDSRFHIGSTTKTMTALLIQMLVNEEKIRYDTPLEKALPDIPMREEYRQVSLAALLLNQAGILPLQRSDTEAPAVWQKLWHDIPAAFSKPEEQRHEVAKFALNLAPINKPGTKAVYSNTGWSIAGHIIDAVADRPYEAFLQERIFRPLGMKKAKIGGWPASSAEPDQPRGHYPAAGGLPQPQELENNAYIFPNWMNPAGGVHCSITDFALYVQENLAGLQGHGRLLDKKGYDNIHTLHLSEKISDMYAYNPQMSGQKGTVNMGYGWAISTFQGSSLSTASGSGGTFYATIAVYPALDIGFAGFTSCGDGSAALEEAILQMTGLDDSPAQVTSATGTAKNSNKLLEGKAQAWIELMVAEKFDLAAGFLDKTFTAHLPVAAIRDSWASLISQVGNFQSIRSISSVNKDNLDYVSVTCVFTRAVIIIRVIYDSAEKIVGLEIKPSV
ncbi:MAG TPA: serine hydrolase [Dehalococcoidales bacterium]|nr:serine hydrolase [Dehalococcoidales bacterium]